MPNKKNNKYLTPNVLKVIIEYDEKANNYGKGNIIGQPDKNKIHFSDFSDFNELNTACKRTDNETKVGDQRSIVDFINFYPVSTVEEKGQVKRLTK